VGTRLAAVAVPGPAVSAATTAVTLTAAIVAAPRPAPERITFSLPDSCIVSRTEYTCSDAS
jgi:hypothetical protein